MDQSGSGPLATSTLGGWVGYGSGPLLSQQQEPAWNGCREPELGQQGHSRPWLSGSIHQVWTTLGVTPAPRPPQAQPPTSCPLFLGPHLLACLPAPPSALSAGTRGGKDTPSGHTPQ